MQKSTDNGSPIEDVAKDRRVIPRWFPPSQSVELGVRPSGELLAKRKEAVRHYMDSALATDQAEKSQESALRVVGLARQFELLTPNTEIIERSGVENLEALANMSYTSRLPNIDLIPHKQQVIERYGRLKAHIRTTPKDAIAWCELARCKAMMGHIDKSTTRQIRIALATAPDNVYVLRAASRFFSHTGKHEKALEVIRSAGYWDRNPWLLAAEIATSTAAGVTSKGIDKGRKLILAGQPQQTNLSELSAAIATEEWLNGANKKSARLINGILPHATENAIAQAQSLSLDIPAISVPAEILAQPGNHEANFMSALFRRDWNGVIEFSERWRAMEPFSSRPVILGSCLAFDEGTAKSADRLASMGLDTDPYNVMLLNNRAYCRLILGEVESARVDIALALVNAEASTSPFLLATLGLLAYRTGDIDLGRRCYFSAINALKDAQNMQSAAMGQLQWIRAEVCSGVLPAQVASEYVSEAKLIDNTAYPTYSAMADLIKDQQLPQWFSTIRTPKNTSLIRLSEKFSISLSDPPLDTTHPDKTSTSALSATNIGGTMPSTP